MRYILLYTIPLLFMAILAVSCSKKNTPDTPFGKVQGRWKLVQMGTDDDGDGIVEGYEIHAVSPVQDIERTYNGNGTGIETSTFDGTKQPDLNFNWGILGYDSLRLLYRANDTVTYLLVNVTASDMTLTENTKPAISWWYFVRK